MNTRMGDLIASWVAGAEFAQLPRRVVEEAKNQILSMLAAVHAGHFSEAGRMVSRTVRDWAGGKEATLIPSGERTSVHYAIFGNAALGMALDYDDYLFGGSTGQSSVLATLSLAEKTGVGGRDFLLAQVLANEVGGRIGILSLTGSATDRQVPIVHAAASAVSAAKLLKLDSGQVGSALAIALSQSGMGSPAAYFGSDAKSLFASAAAPLGVQAAELAASGFRSVCDVFDEGGGLRSAHPGRPTRGVLSGLGKVWLTDTLCYKVYPASAHLGAVLDCVLNLVRQHHLDARKVGRVEVHAGPAAVEQNEAAARFLCGPESLPPTLASSVPYSVAVALLDKELSPRQLTNDRIKDRAVWDLASKVTVSLDDELARRAGERSPFRSASASADAAPFDLETADLVGFRMGFGARVRIEMQDGRSFQTMQESPYGGGTRPFEDRRKAVEDKFRRETRYTLRKERMEKAIDLVHHLEDASASHVREMIRLCCSERA
jgi:2-methylcitrate dehydratase PrpD